MGQDLRFERRDWREISNHARAAYLANQIVVDSFLEEHLTSANCYAILEDNELAGFFAIHDESTVVLFHVLDRFGHMA